MMGASVDTRVSTRFLGFDTEKRSLLAPGHSGADLLGYFSVVNTSAATSAMLRRWSMAALRRNW